MSRMIRADEVKEGDLIDFEKDKYADPKGERLEFQTEYGLVDYVERETATCIAVGVQGVDVFGFPPDHLLHLFERDPGKDLES